MLKDYVDTSVELNICRLMAKRKRSQIFSPTPNKRVRAIGRNRRSLPNSRRAKTVWLYGIHAVKAGLNNPARNWQRLLATTKAAAEISGEWEPEIVDRQEIEKVLPAEAVHQGLALEVIPLTQPHFREATAAVAGVSGVVVLLDQVSDPHNIGAILRSAASFGARAVITTERHAPAATGTLAKAASGALEIVPFLRIANLAQALNDLAELGYWRIGLTSDATPILGNVKPVGDVALVLGAEGKGLRRLTAERCDELVRLPVRKVMDQLNVSNAAAIALYELTRDRR